MRVATNPKIFDPPSTSADALQFIDALLAQPVCESIRPGPRHWAIFRRLCQDLRIRGDVVAKRRTCGLSHRKRLCLGDGGHRFRPLRPQPPLASSINSLRRPIYPSSTVKMSSHTKLGLTVFSRQLVYGV